MFLHFGAVQVLANGTKKPSISAGELRPLLVVENHSKFREALWRHLTHLGEKFILSGE
jgi:hypothetical protein